MTTLSALIDIFWSGFWEIKISIFNFKSAKQLDQKLLGFEVVLLQSWVISSKDTIFV